VSAVAIIPARGGSRRIPRKNVRMFHGKPIIAYSIEAAMASGLFYLVYVSTEDEEISEVAMTLGAALLPRPAELAHDMVGTQEVMRHGLSYLAGLGFRQDHACCIYPCAPMLTPDDLRHGFERLTAHVPDGFACVDGWYYWGSARAFLESRSLDPGFSLHMGNGRAIDINVEDDWQRAERMYAELHKETA
jgi:CMP-N-acetylneuraminic acid synthetase